MRGLYASSRGHVTLLVSRQAVVDLQVQTPEEADVSTPHADSPTEYEVCPELEPAVGLRTWHATLGAATTCT